MYTHETRIYIVALNKEGDTPVKKGGTGGNFVISKRYTINPAVMSTNTAEPPVRGHCIYINKSEPGQMAMALCCRGLSEGKR